MRREKIRRIAGNSTVVLLTNRRDYTTDWVVRELRRRGASYYRLNTELIAKLKVDVDPSQAIWALRGGSRDTLVSEGASFLYRRPGEPLLAGLTRSERLLARAQWKAFVAGLRSIPETRWINDPVAIDAAESKLLQLRTATQLDIPTPPCRITNSKTTVLEFLAANGPSVVKALTAPMLGPVSSPSFFFTRRVTRREIEAMLPLEPTPLIVQAAVWPKVDLRVTVIDQVAFAAVGRSRRMDWREEQQKVSFRPAVIEQQVQKWSTSLVAALGLRFGALDFAIDTSGRPFFLELNPNGEWGWLQRAGLPIAEATADALLAEPQGE